ncbi:alpha/beta fold hydrolase [Lampropedia aestuarii]|uniref:alpha/beta fold hydrolase n=1 Tax=Lampropedia aestuarii TaxID=2562762 RepID=UPI0024686764|nr:alpha/beta fold hydrolase [Lampropedia aestuarii]MDH5858855.1 alpha/beta fold hydrolase [Lampropedia aestuarii]
MSANDSQTSERPGWSGPLRLRDMGSFHIGGQAQTLCGQPTSQHLLAAGGQPVELNPNGTYVTGQMYVQYYWPETPEHTTPLFLWHGGGLTGACWETTPDGRTGWQQYFVRRGWDTHVCDAAERGRSGYAPQFWGLPLSQTVEAVFERFRIGPSLQGAALSDAAQYAFAGSQFPAEAFAAFAQQLVPRWAHTDAMILAAYAALLARQAPAALVCHSQGGMFGLTTALNHPERVRAVVALEPSSVPDCDAGSYQVPTLIVLGDYIDGDARWPRMRERILRFAKRNPCVHILPLPARGLHGNSHMLMMDRNHLQIADLVHDWLAAELAKPAEHLCSATVAD